MCFICTLCSFIYTLCTSEKLTDEEGFEITHKHMLECMPEYDPQPEKNGLIHLQTHPAFLLIGLLYSLTRRYGDRMSGKEFLPFLDLTSESQFRYHFSVQVEANLLFIIFYAMFNKDVFLSTHSSLSALYNGSMSKLYSQVSYHIIFFYILTNIYLSLQCVMISVHSRKFCFEHANLLIIQAALAVYGPFPSHERPSHDSRDSGPGIINSDPLVQPFFSDDDDDAGSRASARSATQSEEEEAADVQDEDEAGFEDLKPRHLFPSFFTSFSNLFIFILAVPPRESLQVEEEGSCRGCPRSPPQQPSDLPPSDLPPENARCPRNPSLRLSPCPPDPPEGPRQHDCWPNVLLFMLCMNFFCCIDAFCTRIAIVLSLI